MLNVCPFARFMVPAERSQRIPMYPSGHKNPGVAAIIFLLDDWLNALEEGVAGFHLPDPNHQRPDGRPPWTEEELDDLIRDLDYEVDREVSRAPGTSVGARAGPAFCRLAVPQRLALAQQLEQLLEGHAAEFQEVWEKGGREQVQLQRRGWVSSS